MISVISTIFIIAVRRAFIFFFMVLGGALLYAIFTRLSHAKKQNV